MGPGEARLFLADQRCPRSAGLHTGLRITPGRAANGPRSVGHYRGGPRV